MDFVLREIRGVPVKKGPKFLRWTHSTKTLYLSYQTSLSEEDNFLVGGVNVFKPKNQKVNIVPKQNPVRQCKM